MLGVVQPDGKKKSNAMSTDDQKRTSIRRSKMDRYTEDLKYNLRRRLSDSVSKGHLRTDDILARSHRQIVADFTDPRQWYYSATHDYIISIMRESQKQNSGSAFGEKVRTGSRQKDKKSLQRHGKSSPTAVESNRLKERKKKLIVDVPTETAEDLRDIRRHDEIGLMHENENKANDSGSLVSMQNETTGINAVEEENERESVQLELESSVLQAQTVRKTFLSEAYQQNIRDNQSLDSQPASDQFDVKNTKETKDQSEDHTKDFAGGTEGSMFSDEYYNSVAMEAYRASKQSLLSQSPFKTSQISSTIQQLPYLPEIMEPFLPIKKRAGNSGVHKPNRNLPVIGVLGMEADDSTDLAQRSHESTMGLKRSRVLSQRRRAAMHVIPARIPSSRTDDTSYVEHWIRKLPLDKGISFTDENGSKPLRRHDRMFPKVLSDRRHRPAQYDQSNQYQHMSLPNDFKPLPTFEPFQPLTSLYIYSLKQKSDLKVKFQHMELPRPLRAHSEGLEHLPHRSFTDDLKQTRTKMTHIEKKLDELYDTEAELTKVLAREKITLLPRKAEVVQTQKETNEITINKSECLFTHGIPTKEGPQSKTSLQKDVVPQSIDVQSVASVPAARDVSDRDKLLSRLDRDSQLAANMNVVNLELPVIPEHPEMCDGELESSCFATPGKVREDYHLPSASYWKQDRSTSDTSGDVKALEAKTIRVFDSEERPQSNDSGSRRRKKTHKKIKSTRDTAEHHSGNDSGKESARVITTSSSFVREIIDALIQDSVPSTGKDCQGERKKVTDRASSGKKKGSNPSSFITELIDDLVDGVAPRHRPVCKDLDHEISTPISQTVAE